MTSHDSRCLWDRWIELWNGDLGLATDIIHPEFALPRIPPPRIPGQLRGGRRFWRGSARPAHCSIAFV